MYYILHIKSVFSVMIPANFFLINIVFLRQSGSESALRLLRILWNESTSRTHYSKTSAFCNYNSKLSLLNTTQVYINNKQSLLNTTQVYINNKQSLLNTTQVYVNNKQSLLNTTQVYVNNKQTLLNTTQVYVNNRAKSPH